MFIFTFIYTYMLTHISNHVICSVCTKAFCRFVFAFGWLRMPSDGFGKHIHVTCATLCHGAWGRPRGLGDGPPEPQLATIAAVLPGAVRGAWGRVGMGVLCDLSDTASGIQYISIYLYICLNNSTSNIHVCIRYVHIHIIHC